MQHAGGRCVLTRACLLFTSFCLCCDICEELAWRLTSLAAPLLFHFKYEAIGFDAFTLQQKRGSKVQSNTTLPCYYQLLLFLLPLPVCAWKRQRHTEAGEGNNFGSCKNINKFHLFILETLLWINWELFNFLIILHKATKTAFSSGFCWRKIWRTETEIIRNKSRNI